MDRTKIETWLTKPIKTWRWPLKDAELYQAVEATSDGLRWYVWSHNYEDGGEREAENQSFVSFLKGKPAKPMPEAINNELKNWILENYA